MPGLVIARLRKVGGRLAPVLAAWLGSGRCGLAGARHGSVALEFALAAPILLLLLGFTLDFSLLLRARIALSSGLMTAVQYAIVTGPTVTPDNLRLVMQHASPLAGLSSSVAGPGCYCPSTYPVQLTAATCGSTCASTSAPAGTYVTVTGTYAYTPMMPGLSHMVATTVVLSATAMLQ